METDALKVSKNPPKKHAELSRNIRKKSEKSRIFLLRFFFGLLQKGTLFHVFGQLPGCESKLSIDLPGVVMHGYVIFPGENLGKSFILKIAGNNGKDETHCR